MTKSTPITPQRIIKKLMQNLKLNTNNGCWEWQSNNKLHGYGSLELGSKQGPRYFRERAHRTSYRMFVGPIPDGLFVCHKCDNPPCCNPKHLFVGTAKQNVQDALDKKRWGTFEDRSARGKKAIANYPRQQNIFGQFMKDGEDPSVYKGQKISKERLSTLIKAAIPRGENHYAAKLSNKDVEKIFELRAKGQTYKQIGSIFNVDFTCIYKIIKRKRRNV